MTENADTDVPGVSFAKRLVTQRRTSGKLPPLVLGVGDALGFSGSISPAKLAAGDGLDEVAAGFELRVHGVGGSSPEQLLEQPETVQVGGDDIGQFVRRWMRTSTRESTVRWPLEGYWWGGLTSKPSSRAFWVLLLPLMLCNMASWMIPTTIRTKSRRQWAAGSTLPPVMRLAGYALTLLLTASLMTAITDVFGWQCAGTYATPPAGKQGGRISCLPGWLGWTPAASGPRLVVFTLIPVLVVAAIGYACHRTLRSYERWTLPYGLPEDHESRKGAPSWPLTANGFWHGLRPVRRQQWLHLAGAGALISFYLADMKASHPAVHIAAMAMALALVVVPAATLLCPLAGRSAVDPHSARESDMDVTWFDWVCGTLLGLSLATLAGLLVARIWWQPVVPTARLPMRVGLMPADAGAWGVWWVLTWVMGGLVLVAILATTAALDPRSIKSQTPRRERTFAGGFMTPLTLGLSCVLGGIFAGGLNLLLPSLLIGSEFRNTGPALAGAPSKGYPLVLPVPVFGFMTGLLFLTGMVLLTAFSGLVWFVIVSWRKSRVKFLRPIYRETGNFYERHTGRQRWPIAFAWTQAEIADHVGFMVTSLSLAGIGGIVAFDIFAAARAHGFSAYWVTLLAHDGQWLGLIVAGALYGYTRQAFKDSGKRRSVGVLWDVGTFWPRASQPLAPPCYMERSIPETVNRLRRALGDIQRTRGEERNRPRGKRKAHPDPATDPEENYYIGELLSKDPPTGVHKILLNQERVLINGYSQGSPIAAAIIAQLPQPLRNRVYLVTVGSPLRRLYGRAFPAYFGQNCLLELASQLAQEDGEMDSPGLPDVGKAEVLDATRWRNMRRPSDYIGSYIFSEPMNRHAASQYPVDKLVLDPPRIIPAHATTPPPIHRHSDFWPDPRVATLTEELLNKKAFFQEPRPVPYTGNRNQRRVMRIFRVTWLLPRRKRRDPAS